jgi:hypothetical protein
MPTITEIRAAASQHRIQAEGVGVAVLAIVVAVVLGVSAKRSASAMQSELQRLRAASQELSGFRAAFQPGTAAQDSIQLPESMTVAIPRDVRITLAQRIATTAEESGLSDVRVRFASADSTGTPAVPQFSALAPTVANYSMVIDASGRFAPLLSLVNHLPPSVAIQRLQVTRGAGGTAVYQLILAVFESAKQNQHG